MVNAVGMLRGGEDWEEGEGVAARMEGGGQASRTVRKEMRLRSTSVSAALTRHAILIPRTHSVSLVNWGLPLTFIANRLGKIEPRLTYPNPKIKKFYIT